jgi:predicted outer membrane lipoprotein
MPTTNYRRTLPITRIMLAVAGVLVLAVGFALYVLTTQTDRYFAWTVGSLLTAAFLGGSYWSAAVLELISARRRLWVNSRPSIPAVTIFTFLTLIVTLMHADKFHFNAPLLITRAGTWFWLVVYISVPVILTILFILQLRVPGDDPPRRYPLAGWVRPLQITLAALFLLLGAALLITPLSVAPFWPWPLTPLTGRAVGAWLVGIGIAAGQAAWENDKLCVRAVMASFIAFALLQFLALARYRNELAWSSPSAWLYIVILLLLGLTGLYEYLAARSLPTKT